MKYILALALVIATPIAVFADDSLSAARDLYATTPSVVNAVTQAWTAVGVN